MADRIGSLLSDKTGSPIEIYGWTQNGSRPGSEINKLRIMSGAAEFHIDLNTAGDELKQWCEQHGLPCTDMRKKQASP